MRANDRRQPLSSMKCGGDGRGREGGRKWALKSQVISTRVPMGVGGLIWGGDMNGAAWKLERDAESRGKIEMNQLISRVHRE
jgi:hypothetical protein